MEIPRADILLSPFVLEYVKDPRSIAAQFFDKAHHWMSIISKKRFYDQLLNPLSQPRTDTIMLLFCMKLLTWIPPDYENEPRTPAYMAAKYFMLEANLAGMFTVQLLQAALLIALYELGHAIYPAAYLTVGACARYGLALGIDKRRTSDSGNSPFTPLEQEERRRVGWAIVILDRCESPSVN